jgi:hypothetical protein
MQTNITNINSRQTLAIQGFFFLVSTGLDYVVNVRGSAFLILTELES